MKKLPEDLKVLHIKVKRLYPTDYDKIQGILNNLGMAVKLAIFIDQMSDFVQVPDDVRYAIANTIQNFLSMKSEDNHKVVHLPHDPFKDNKEEKLLMVAKHLIDNLKKRGLI